MATSPAFAIPVPFAGMPAPTGMDLWRSDRAYLALLILWAAVVPIGWIAAKGTQPLLWALALTTVWAAARPSGTFALPRRHPLYLLFLVPAVGLASSAWSIDPEASLLRALRLGLEVAGCVILVLATARLDRTWRRGLVRALALGAAVGTGLILLDMTSRGMLLGPLWGRPEWVWHQIAYNRGATLQVLFLPILLLAALRPSAGPLVVIGVTLGVMAVGGAISTAAKLALVVTFAVFLAVWLVPIAARLVGLGAAAVLLLTPWLLLAVPGEALVARSGLKAASTVHRAMIWDFAAARIAERPLLGWGLDASRRIPGGNDTVDFVGTGKLECEVTEFRVTQARMPLHPHNAALQIWLEMGALGALATAGLLALAGHMIARAVTDAATRAAHAAMLAGATVIAFVSYGAWQGWWLSALFIAVAAIPLSRSRDHGDDDPAR